MMSILQREHTCSMDQGERSDALFEVTKPKQLTFYLVEYMESNIYMLAQALMTFYG